MMRMRANLRTYVRPTCLNGMINTCINQNQRRTQICANWEEDNPPAVVCLFNPPAMFDALQKIAPTTVYWGRLPVVKYWCTGTSVLSCPGRPKSKPMDGPLLMVIAWSCVHWFYVFTFLLVLLLILLIRTIIINSMLLTAVSVYQVYTGVPHGTSLFTGTPVPCLVHTLVLQQLRTTNKTHTELYI